MKKILCPIDFSRTSINALEYAVKIGRKYNSSLTLLYVFTEEEFGKILEMETDVKSFSDLRQQAEEKLAGLVHEIKETSLAKGLASCQYNIIAGNLTDKISEYSRSQNFQLVVMGTKGVSDIAEAYMGSNTVHVIEKSECPVLCVPEKASYSSFNKIVYATDYQEEDKIIIQQLISFAMIFKSEIVVLHVSNKETTISEAIDEQYRQELINFINYDNIRFAKKIYDEEVNNAIDRFVMEENAELLVLLKRHRNFLGKLFNKSITSSLSYYTDYPLLIFQT